MPDISFITINYNGQRDTVALVRSLQSVVHSLRWEVVIVDNASSGGDAFALRTIFAADPRIKVVEAPANLGFAGGNNLGIGHATAPYLMLINNDTFVEQDHFRQLIAHLEANPGTGIVSPLLRFADGQRPIQYAGFTELTAVTLRNRSIGNGEPDHGQYTTPRTTAFAHGAAMLFPRRTLEAAGPMTEEYFLYYEEMDWSLQVRRAGLHILFDPVQTVFHRESQTTGTDTPLRTYYMTRNRLLFARRNCRTPLRYLTYAYITLVALVRDIPRHILHGRNDLVRATLHAVRDFAANKSGKQN